MEVIKDIENLYINKYKNRKNQFNKFTNRN